MLFPHSSARPAPSQLPCYPTTFLERGVAVPFTTPMLAGTRVRPTARGGTELIVPNLSGRSGVYILPWHGIRDLCRPNPHDLRLSTRVSRLDMVTPEALRHAARDVATEGLAEHALLGIAAPGGTRDQADRKLTNFLLLLALVRQREPVGTSKVPPERERPAELVRRALLVITRLAPLLDCTPGTIAASLEQLAGLLASTGIGRQAPQARHTRGMENLHRLRDETRVWSLQQADEDAAMASLVAAVTDHTLTSASTAMTAARGLSDDMVVLLRHWHATPEAIGQRATRPDWLLDEWEPICRIWRGAETQAARRDALREIALMVPAVPRAFAAWMGHAFAVDEIPNFRQGVRRNQDWRTGLTMLAPIVRDERTGLMAAVAPFAATAQLHHAA